MCYRILGFLIPIVFFLIPGRASSANDLVCKPISFLSIPQTVHPPDIDGRLDDPCWKNGVKLDDFVLTAGKPGQPPLNRTHCILLFDATHLYISFECLDTNMSKIKAGTNIWDDSDILYDDRVVVFLDINHDHRSYFELAVNPKGIQFDQSGYYRLHGSRTSYMDPGWNCFWRAKTHVEKDKWTVEIAIDVTSLGIPKIVEGQTWGLNLARVRQPAIVKGDELNEREPGRNAEYSAWAFTQDRLGETISNFYAPLEFGDLVFGSPGLEVNEISFRSALYKAGPLGYPTLYGWNPLELRFGKCTEREVELRLRVEPETLPSWEFAEKIQLSSGRTIKTRYWIPEMLDNKISIEILNPETQKQLFYTSYHELAPPFIEFNLEPLYTRRPSEANPLEYRLLTDEKTRTNSSLALQFKTKNQEKVIASQVISDLTHSDEFSAVFDINQLRSLEGGNYIINCKLYNKADNTVQVEFEQSLTKYDKKLPEEFGAVEGDYSYGGITDHGIRIRYPFAAEFAFWRSASYIPWWDIEQAAMSNEFVECWGDGHQGCCEPMQDRACRYSKVEVIENSSARVVVHWRYALSDAHYNIYKNEWVDEFYTIYADGVGVREINLWPNSSTRHEMFEVLLVKPPGVTTKQIFDKKFATMTNLRGEEYSNGYLSNHGDFYQEFIEKFREFIIEVHFKDRMHPFTVFSLRDKLLPGVTPAHVDVCSRSIGHADRRGHWPASRYQVDGFNTPGLDVPHHGNIGNIQAEVDAGNQPTTWKFLIGVTGEEGHEALEYATSWLYPGAFEILDGNCSYSGYNFSDRAYMIKAEHAIKSCRMKFITDKNEVLNPVFLIDYPDHTVDYLKIDEKEIGRQFFRTGVSADNKIVLHLIKSLQDRQTISIVFNQ